MAEAQVVSGSGDTGPGPGHGCLTAGRWGSGLPPPGISPLDVCSPAETEICCPVLHELKVICNQNVMQILSVTVLFMCCLLSSLASDWISIGLKEHPG